MWLHQQVMSKKTGLPAVGWICGIVSPVYWIQMQKNINPEVNFARWDRLYPDWTKKPLYYIMFEKPQKYMSPEECEEQGCNFEDVPESQIITYPFDDLELL